MRTWREIRRELLEGTRRVVRVSADEVPHPSTEGAVRSVGLPVGQVEDWRFPADDKCRGLHVQMIDGMWVAHVDRIHPDCGGLRHLFADAPAVGFVGSIGLGASLGFVFQKTVIGAGIGLVFGGLMVCRDRGVRGVRSKNRKGADRAEKKVLQ